VIDLFKIFIINSWLSRPPILFNEIAYKNYNLYYNFIKYYIKYKLQLGMYTHMFLYFLKLVYDYIF